MSNHVFHLLTAYINHELPRADRNRVFLHVQECAACRDALARESDLRHDLQAVMPTFGQPTRRQLARLWPSIWQEFRNGPTTAAARLSSYGMALALMVMVAVFVTMALFNGPTQAIAAPVQAQPSDIRATWTAVYTVEPITAEPKASRTIAADSEQTDSHLMASPAPVAAVSFNAAGWR